MTLGSGLVLVLAAAVLDPASAGWVGFALGAPLSVIALSALFDSTDLAGGAAPASIAVVSLWSAAAAGTFAGHTIALLAGVDGMILTLLGVLAGHAVRRAPSSRSDVLVQHNRLAVRK